MHTAAAGPRSGATLVELTIVLLLLGIMTALAAPNLSRWISVHRVNVALNYLRGDVNYARTLAVRSGRPVELRFSTDGGDSCAATYAITIRDDPWRVAKRVRVADEIRGVCLTHSNPGVLVFNSRGLPHGVAARTFRASSGGVKDSLRLSQAGRLYRAY